MLPGLSGGTGEFLIIDGIAIGERSADLTEDVGRGNRVCPAIGVLEQRWEGLAGMRMRDGAAERSPEPFTGPNLMHLLWFVSSNVMGAVVPGAGASW
jgi:hypothetical protein